MFIDIRNSASTEELCLAYHNDTPLFLNSDITNSSDKQVIICGMCKVLYLPWSLFSTSKLDEKEIMIKISMEKLLRISCIWIISICSQGVINIGKGFRIQVNALAIAAELNEFEKIIDDIVTKARIKSI